MSRSRKHAPIVKDSDRWFKRHGRRRFRAREHVALATGRYDEVPVKPQEASQVYQWADWVISGWRKRPQRFWQATGDWLRRK